LFDFFSRFKSQPPKGSADDGLKTLVGDMARALVDHPEKVEVKTVEGDTSVAIELRVASEDLGKVIGRKGRTAGAMRTILGAAGTRSGKKYVLEILE